MGFSIRPADLKSDRARIMELLRKHFPGLESREVFEWRYLQNPAGTARVWLLEDGVQCAGFSGAFPRSLRAGSGVLAGWALGDFCVEPEQRSLGPAIRLQRVAHEALGRGEVDVWYDFPSRSMLAVYGRMKLRPTGEMIRLVYPLKVDSYLETKMSVPVLIKGLSVVGNAFLGARDSVRSRVPTMQILPFDEDFTDSVPCGLEGRGGIYLERTAEYLNWRYRNDPRALTSVLAAHGKERIEGFLVFSRAGAEFVVVDAFGTGIGKSLRELVIEVVTLARRQGAERVTVSISDQHPWKAVLEELGFQSRDSVPFIAALGSKVREGGAPWFLMSGDRDL